MKKIGFYGGSFNPIHFGHLNLALEISEKHQLTKVLFSPAFIPPQKLRDEDLLSIDHRLQMTKLAISDIPHFELSDLEAKRQEISYTVDALKELKELYPDSELYLILGFDALHEFSSWKNPGEILSLAQPLTGSRETLNLDPNFKYRQEFQKGMTKTPLLDISSSEIRKRIQKNVYIKHLVPSKVVDYIYEHHLY